TRSIRWTRWTGSTRWSRCCRWIPRCLVPPCYSAWSHSRSQPSHRHRRRERMVSMAQPPTAVYALLADGTTVEIRPAVRADFDAVKAMQRAMPRDNSCLRFFNVSRLSAEIEARRIARNPKPGSAALLAVADGEVVGVASYVPLREDPGTAEVAFAVADHMHHRGIATLLLEHLVSL